MFDKFISNIITTNKKRTITAPTYTKINIIDKNSAFINNHKTAEQKNERTKNIAALTELLTIITFKAENTNKSEKNIKISNSVDIIYLVYVCSIFDFFFFIQIANF